MLLMGKSTINGRGFNSFLYVYQAGYISSQPLVREPLLPQLRLLRLGDPGPWRCWAWRPWRQLWRRRRR